LLVERRGTGSQKAEALSSDKQTSPDSRMVYLLSQTISVLLVAQRRRRRSLATQQTDRAKFRTNNPKEEYKNSISDVPSSSLKTAEEIGVAAVTAAYDFLF
jgi:hypothetical protein